LGVPKFPLNPATVFPGAQPGTSDDVRPFNNFLQQQTTLRLNGTAYWPAPDLVPIATGSKIEQIGNNSNSYDYTITVVVRNQGNRKMKIDHPIYATVYNGTVDPANRLALFVSSSPVVLEPGATITMGGTYSGNVPLVKVVVQVNDNYGSFPEIECDYNNNKLELINTAYSQFMKKRASIGSTPGNGLYGNPVSVLNGDIIHYKITAKNVSQNAGTVIIRDTLPAYLMYVSGTAHPSGSSIFHDNPNVTEYGPPNRHSLMWTLNVASMADTTVSYDAMPMPGVCASEPMFINRAWITVQDVTTVETDSSTYHQGTGVCTLSLFAGHGGSIYNAQPQILDYRTSARSGVLVVPDEGYAFVGWSHGDYYSLRGELIKAKSGIMYYDTLIIYGDVELTANFEPIRYPIRYYLNGGKNVGNNPEVYTRESGVITIEEPSKVGDVFVGWTGSNGVEPQKTVTIPEGSTGELEFYANYLQGGRENLIRQEAGPDKIWAANDELYVRTSKTGSIVRIYSTEGILTGLHTILSTGLTKIKLQRGIYIVTLNNGVAQKIIIE
jgi:uncharacterized repeat protein (TIGR02543 family)/uncharacterized repeat protein (TIGR01451 family)